ncbi:MAG: carbon storage regulator [Planctomycetaceae bacterium]|nr:carbon storage regulator [Planctomycetaceae bacterium]
MLVLTRKKNETIHIGGNVVVKVIATGRGKVKIGIEAPETVRVRRGELNPAEGTAVHSDDSEGDSPELMTYEVALA